MLAKLSIISIVRTCIIATLLSGTNLVAQDTNLFEREEIAMREAVAAIAPSVVRVETFATVGRLAQVAGTGPTTGLIVSEEGYVLSSAFNFIAKPESILVTLHDGQRVSASIHARDTNRQLVLLRLEDANKAALIVPRIRSKSTVRPGQWAIAVGRTLDNERPNLSVGIVSATDRIWGKAIQTDAKISPNNYGGPLIDLHGQVMGILAPLSPQGGSEFAGSEWYDSGIGFAVPLDDVLARLDVLINGTDLKAGLMGIALKGNDLFGSAAEIAVCRQRTPAFVGGLRVGDVITSLNGQAIERQSQLKHTLGPLYAGDSVSVVAKRGEDQVNATITLTDEIAPYAHPFIGILPRRDSEKCIVRYVYPESPAALAGVTAGDSIVQLDAFKVASDDSLRQHVASLEDAQQVTIDLRRDEENLTVKLTLADLPATVPPELPPAATSETIDDATPAEIVEIKLPEEAGQCVALLPANYDAQLAYGLLVDIDEPGSFDKGEFKSKWSGIATAHSLIVLAPQPKSSRQWLPTESDFIRKTIESAKDSYNVDHNRVALVGYRSGGSMAMLTARRNREVIRAIATVDSSISVGRDVITDPANRMAIYCALASETKNVEVAREALKYLKTQRFPVTEIDLGTSSRPLSEDELNGLCRWIDSLDRI